MKTKISILLFLIFSSSISFSQITEEMYTKKVEEGIALKNEIKELEKTITKLSIDTTKLSKDLKKEKKNNADNKEDLDKIKDYKKQIADLEKETKTIPGLNSQIDKLKEDLLKFKGFEAGYYRLRSDSSVYASKIKGIEDNYNSEKEKNKKLAKFESEYKRVKNDSADLERKIKDLDGKFNTANLKALKFDNLDRKYNKLKSDSTALQNNYNNLDTKNQTNEKEIARLKSFETEVLSLRQTKTKLEERIKILEPFEQNKKELETQLRKSLDFSVEYLINSSDYDIEKADLLIKDCNETYSKYIDAATIKNYVNKIDNYKKIANAINESKKILEKAFDATSNKAAISLLQQTQTNASAKIKKDIAKQTDLLKDYCKFNNEAELYYQKADNFSTTSRDNCFKVLDEILNKLPLEYIYLKSELSKKRVNEFHKCKITKASCN